MSPKLSHFPSRRLLMLELPVDPAVSRLFDLARADGSFEIRVAELSELKTLMKEDDTATIFFCTIDNADVLKPLTDLFNSQLRAPLKNGRLMAIALNRLQHRQVPKILKKIGFTEIISAQGVKGESLKFRIEELFSRFHFADMDGKVSSEMRSSLVVRECKIRVTSAIETDFIIWLLRQGSDIRIVNGQWIIDLVGPGPSAGKWVSMESDEKLRHGPKDENESEQDEKVARWKWVPSERSDASLQHKGHWVFEGKKPRFNEFHWTFTSDRPKLGYFQGSRLFCEYFFSGTAHTLFIAANSKAAQKKWPVLHASVLNEYRYSVKAERIQTVEWGKVSTKESSVPWRQLMGIQEEPEKPEWEVRRAALQEIQQHTSPQTELFAKVSDNRTRNSFIREMAQQHCSALVWSTGQKIRFGANVQDFDKTANSIIVNVPKDLRREELDDILNSQGSRFFLNVNLQRAGVFFAADKVLLRPSGLEIGVPETLYKVQRRSHFRAAIPEERGMFVRVQDQFHRILNLSAGGLAFAAGGKSEIAFKPGGQIERVSLQIYNEKIHCRGEIRWVKPSAGSMDRSEFTVGLQFSDLKELDQQKLNVYVLEEGFEYFRKHVLNL